MEDSQIVPSSTSGRYELDGWDITSGSVIELLVFDVWRKTRVEYLDGLGYSALIPQEKGKDERLAVPLRTGMLARWPSG